MPRILVIIGVVLLILIGGGFFFFKQVLQAENLNVGELRPAVLPPSQNLADIIENKNLESVNFPLKVPPGFEIGLYAKNLGKARGLALTNDGTILVTSMSPTDSKVYALPDRNKDGRADEVKEIISGLKNAHGIAINEGKLYVAEQTAVNRYNLDEQNLVATFDKKLFDLPLGGNHVTRTLQFDKNGKLYVSIGSSCNVCNEKDDRLAAVLVSDKEGTAPKLFAKGLRNSVALTVDDQGRLWGGDNGRDFLGNDLPPEEINIIQDGKDYGWPNCYGNNVADTNFNPQANCNNATGMVYGMGAHQAPLGMTFISSDQFPADYQGDLLVTLHGSWNSTVPVGYKVLRLKVDGDKITGEEDFLTGFISGNDALGRPVDVLFDQRGNLFVSDDKVGNVYIITKKG